MGLSKSLSGNSIGDKKEEIVSPFQVAQQQPGQIHPTPVAQVAPVPRGYAGHPPPPAAAPPPAPTRPSQVVYAAADPGAAVAAAAAAIEIDQQLYMAVQQQQQQQQPQQQVYHQHQQAMAVAAAPPPAPVPAPPPTGYPQMIVPAVPQMAPIEHDSNYDIYPPGYDSLNTYSASIETPSRVATKSLSALKSRKEEIIDHLEDLVGKEETEKIQERAVDPPLPIPPVRGRIPAPNQPAPAGSVVVSSTNAGGENIYSIWTSRSITNNLNIPSLSKEYSAPLPSSRSSSPSKSVSVEPGQGQGHDDEGHDEVDDEDDEMIPFSDTPHISRFGPISRRSGTLLQSATPSQSQAVISDEPTPTAVVRHSKQMARQAPSVLFHQNGSRTTLQPVAVGANGEIGYIAVQEPSPFPTSDSITLQQIQQNSALHQASPSPVLHPHHLSGGPATPGSGTGAGGGGGDLYAQSQRMKMELEQLQKKISDLSVAHMETQQQQITINHNGIPMGPEELRERNQLTTELRIIESTIRDREREMSINRRI